LADIACDSHRKSGAAGVSARFADNASAKRREAKLPRDPPSLFLNDFNSSKTGLAKSNVVLMMFDVIKQNIRCQQSRISPWACSPTLAAVLEHFGGQG
jgi:hypothetical protein